VIRRETEESSHSGQRAMDGKAFSSGKVTGGGFLGGGGGGGCVGGGG